MRATTGSPPAASTASGDGAPGATTLAAGAVDAGDRELVRRYLETRSEEAFRALYRTHASYLFGLALRVCAGRHDLAEDALQEAWIRAAAKLDAFRWQSRLATWLGGFVVNCCRENLRRRRSAPLEAAEVASRDADPSDGALPERAERRIDLHRLLARLPDGQRAVLVLHAIEGYTHEEIGRLLDIAPGTSKSRLFEARRALRDHHDFSGDSA